MCLNPKVLTKKNAAKSTILRRNSWLAILDEIRKKDRENVLSQTEALKQLDMKEMEELSKQNYFVYN